VRSRRDVIVSECGDAMSDRRTLSLAVSVLGMLERLPRVLRPRQVILLSVLLGNLMGMLCNVV
jgi:hypothetical protein